MSTILSLAILGPILAQAQAPAQAPKAEEYTVKCTVLPTTTRKLRLEGTAPVPDNTMLKFVIYPLVETVYAGERIKIRTIEGSPLTGMPWTPVMGRRFSFDIVGQGPAVYRIRIFKQGSAITATGAGKGQFELVLWDDKHLDKLGDELRVAEDAIKDCKPILEQVRKAVENEKLWAASFKQIEKVVDAQQTKLQRTSTVYYPGGLGEAGNTMRILRGTLQAFMFENGQFKAKDYYGYKNDNRGVQFELPNLIRYIDESVTTVGREFLLWLLKDFRRDGSPANAKRIANEVEKQVKVKHPVITSYASSFKKIGELKPEELEFLEKQLRGDEP
jgi:hypothetical protein